MRIALGIEYDGGQYHGYQKQPGLHTVQGCLEKAISKVANERVITHCAGRTDTGVHATAQVIHFDVDVQRSTRAWIFGVNSNLPKDISVRWSKIVDENFHARFSASSRRYRYVIYNHPIRPGLYRGNVTWQYRPLDEKKMHQAAKCLLGENDFTSFRAVQCQSKTPVRTVSHLNVSRQGDLVIIDIAANAFLHHMVRNIAGVLIAIGNGTQKTEWVADVLAAKDRRAGAETAPPYGLYMIDVTYHDVFNLPKSNLGPLILNA